MSFGLIELMEALLTGTPSITISGSLSADKEAPIRIRMVPPLPGAPLPGTMFTPATLPPERLRQSIAFLCSARPASQLAENQ